MKSTANITCSKAVDECKKPLTGCCSITKDDSEETLTLQEKVPFFEQCNGKRSCSIDSPGMLTDNLQSADYIWLEYSCVKGMQITSIIDIRPRCGKCYKLGSPDASYASICVLPTAESKAKIWPVKLI